jgi:hypothetical protein
LIAGRPLKKRAWRFASHVRFDVAATYDQKEVRMNSQGTQWKVSHAAKFAFATFLMLAILVPAAESAQGVGAAVTSGRKVNTRNVPTGGTGGVRAYSEADNGIVDQVVKEDGVVNPNPTAGPGFSLFQGPFGANTGVPSTVEQKIAAKPPGIFHDIDSKSVGNTAPAKPNGVAEGYAALATRADNTTFLTTIASVSGNYLAGGKAYDPLFFDAGHNTITDTITGISLLARPGDFGSAYQMSMGTDANGLGTLYTLCVFAPAGITSVKDLGIYFQSSGLGWDDQAIADALRADFLVADNTATLMDPFTFMFDLDSPTPYSLDFYDESAAAAENDGEQTPEPSALLLAGSGVLVVGSIVRNRMITQS